MVRVPSDDVCTIIGQGMAEATATRYRLSSAVHASAIVSYFSMDFNSSLRFFMRISRFFVLDGFAGAVTESLDWFGIAL